MIKFCDRIIVIVHAFQIDTRKFGVRYKAVTNGAVNSIDTWMAGGDPRPASHPAIATTLLEFVPESSREAVRNALTDSNLEPWQLLRAAPVRYESIKDVVTDDFRRLVKLGGMQISSIAHMTEFALGKQAAIIGLFNRLRGRWTLYRCHSSETGIMRETVLVEAADAPVGAGTYYQYDATASAEAGQLVYRTLKLNLFFCGDVVTALGVNTYEDGAKLDPVVVSLVTQAVKTQIEPYRDYVHLPGILVAVADAGHMPAAMRVVSRQDTTDAVLADGMAPVAIVGSTSDDAVLYGPAVDNSALAPGSPLLHSHEWLSARLQLGTRELERRRRLAQEVEDDDGA